MQPGPKSKELLPLAVALTGMATPSQAALPQLQGSAVLHQPRVIVILVHVLHSANHARTPELTFFILECETCSEYSVRWRPGYF